MEGEAAARRWTTLLGYVLLVGAVVALELGQSAYDDSYFFKRFALHAVENGALAWNLSDGPVHGSTSQLFGLLTTAVVGFTKTHVIGSLRVVDGALLVAAAALLLRVARGPVVLLALGNVLVLSAVRSNMETALALAVLSAALVRELRPGEGPGRDAESAVATALVYLARPDAAVIVGLVALVRRRSERLSVLPYLVALGMTMGALWMGLWVYYGTALPLSFHMKSMALHTYGPHFASTRWVEKVPYLLVLSVMAAPMVWLLVRARVWRRLDVTSGLALAALLFIAYHALSTREIMGYRARFYVPALVPLCIAASRAWPPQGIGTRTAASFVLAWSVLVAALYGMGWVPTAEGSAIKQVAWPAYAGFAGATLAAFAWPRRPLAVAGCLLAGAIAWLPLEPPTVRSDAEILVRHDREVTTSRGVFDVARCLPPGSTVYHSEMGVPGLVLYRMRLVDMVGLLSADVALEGLRFQERCAAEQPEAIFLPHKAYRALNEEIRASACFSDYVRVVQRSSSPLHVRGDLVEGFLGCAGR